MAARVRDGFLSDSEEVTSHLGRQVDPLDCEPDLEAVAAPPGREAVLDRRLEADLLERVRAEVDDLVAQGAQVAHPEVASLVDEAGGLVAAPVFCRVAGGG